MPTLSFADKYLHIAAVGSSAKWTDMMPHCPSGISVPSLRLPILYASSSRDSSATARLATIFAAARSFFETLPTLTALILVFLP